LEHASTNRILGILLFAAAVLGPAGPVSASAPTSAPAPLVGIDEHLGQTVRKDLKFVSETGDTVVIGDLIDRPVLLTMVYYHCPSICRPLLDEVAAMLGKLQQVDMVPDRDYRVITISFDQFDSASGSSRLKDEYYHQLPDGFPRDAWTFLTADSATIAQFAESVGFGYKRNSKDNNFTHPTTLIVLSPEGKITRYLLGSEYLPLDIKLALVEARHGIVGTTIVKFFKFCFSYDPASHKFALNATRVVGLSTLLGVAGIVVFVAAAGRRREKKVH